MLAVCRMFAIPLPEFVMTKMLPVAVGLLATMALTPAFAQSTSQEGHEIGPRKGVEAPGSAMTSGNMGVPTTRTPAVTTPAPGGTGEMAGEVGSHDAAAGSAAAGTPKGQVGK